MAAQWLEGLQQLLVVVDWSDATQDQRWHLLRASAVVEGRSITLYEEIHPQARYGHPSVHRAFMQKRALIVPAGCKPIVMTDAGFHAPWFKLVVAHGWVIPLYLTHMLGSGQQRSSQAWPLLREPYGSIGKVRQLR